MEPPSSASPARRRSDRPGRRSSVGALAALAVSYVVAGAWAAWWLVGPQAEPGGCDDVLVAPPAWSPLADRPWLVAAVAATGATLTLLTRLASCHRDRGVAQGAVALLSIAAIIAGGGGRVVTASVCGANIGGGLVVLFGAPLALVLVLLALWGLVRSR